MLQLEFVLLFFQIKLLKFSFITLSLIISNFQSLLLGLSLFVLLQCFLICGWVQPHASNILFIKIKFLRILRPKITEI